MGIAKRVGPGLVGAVIMALGGAAVADDPVQRAGESLTLDQAAIAPALLEEQSGTVPEAADGNADLSGVPGGANGATSLDQPSFASSHGSITGGTIASSTLQATTAGGAVSLGQ